eukprot:TRINITY_DN45985_c0_g1_i1.p1 TRINITY_DN45985_c0_g1~~TRINITY_DN45985_c0_g1_i1.p1  ORF type:complete len:310 (+),score=40.43 TRINITY_DN45985_c0_g1_i1:87-1016(+)
MVVSDRITFIKQLVLAGYCTRVSISQPMPGKVKTRFVIDRSRRLDHHVPLLVSVVDALRNAVELHVAWDHGHRHSSRVTTVDVYYRISMPSAFVPDEGAGPPPGDDGGDTDDTSDHRDGQDDAVTDSLNPATSSAVLLGASGSGADPSGPDAAAGALPKRPRLQCSSLNWHLAKDPRTSLVKGVRVREDDRRHTHRVQRAPSRRDREDESWFRNPVSCWALLVSTMTNYEKTKERRLRGAACRWLRLSYSALRAESQSNRRFIEQKKMEKMIAKLQSLPAAIQAFNDAQRHSSAEFRAELEELSRRRLA